MGETGSKFSQTFEQLSAHLVGLERDDEGVRLLGDFLRRVVHDLRTPIGVFSLELFSVEEILDEARTALASGETGKVTETLETVSDIAQNLSRAQNVAQELIESLDACYALLTAAPPGES